VAIAKMACCSDKHDTTLRHVTPTIPLPTFTRIAEAVNPILIIYLTTQSENFQYDTHKYSFEGYLTESKKELIVPRLHIIY